MRLKWDAATPLIYTGCLDGVVRLWDSRSGNCEREWYGHNGEILDLAVARYKHTNHVSVDPSLTSMSHSQ